MRSRIIEVALNSFELAALAAFLAMIASIARWIGA